MLLALYSQSPLVFWSVVAAAVLAVDLAAGLGFLVWAALAAFAMGLLSLTGFRLGPLGDLVLFAILAISSVEVALGKVRLPARVARARRPSQALDLRDEGGRDEDDVAAAAAEPARRHGFADISNRDDDLKLQSGRIIGRIARTTGPFVGGIGHVWIDGLEWAAEIDTGEALGADAPVRVMAVVDDDRLQVAGLPV